MQRIDCNVGPYICLSTWTVQTKLVFSRNVGRCSSNTPKYYRLY